MQKKVGWCMHACTELLTTSKCTNAKCKLAADCSRGAELLKLAVEECRAKLEVCRAELEVSGEYQKGWFA